MRTASLLADEYDAARPVPASRPDAKYEGKTAIDTFFWRIGDLIQAGVVFAGLHWLDWTAAISRCSTWRSVLVDRPGVRHRPRVPRARAEEFLQRAAEVGQPIPDLMYARVNRSGISCRRTRSAMQTRATC